MSPDHGPLVEDRSDRDGGPPHGWNRCDRHSIVGVDQIHERPGHPGIAPGGFTESTYKVAGVTDDDGVVDAGFSMGQCRGRTGFDLTALLRRRSVAETDRVLVVYGDPPRMDLLDARGGSLRKTFSLTSQNQSSFQLALKGGLGQCLGGHVAIQEARFVYIRNLSEFSAALRGGQYSRVVYYGHALSGVNVLLPGIGSNIAPFHIAGLLKGSSIKHFDILGCSGASIAGELATLVSKDIKKLTIDQQALLHYDGQMQ